MRKIPKHRMYARYTQGIYDTKIECACGWSTQWQTTSAQARTLYNDHEADTDA